MFTPQLDGRYVDKEKLVKQLKELFGAGRFQVKVCALRPRIRVENVTNAWLN